MEVQTLTPDLADNPNAWALPELINIGLLIALYLGGLAASLWHGCRAGRARLYWIACAGLMIAGTLAMVFAAPDTPTDGEMPRQFALGTWAMLAGLGGAVAGLVWRGCRWIQARRARRAGPSV
jgi:hypothetical protein